MLDNRRGRKRDLTSQEIVGTRLDRRSQVMYGLRHCPSDENTLMLLIHLAWLGPQIFRGQRPREGIVSYIKPSRRAEKPHLGHVGWKKRGNLGGVVPQGTSITF